MKFHWKLHGHLLATYQSYLQILDFGYHSVRSHFQPMEIVHSIALKSHQLLWNSHSHLIMLFNFFYLNKAYEWDEPIQRNMTMSINWMIWYNKCINHYWSLKKKKNMKLIYINFIPALQHHKFACHMWSFSNYQPNQIHLFFFRISWMSFHFF